MDWNPDLYRRFEGERTQAALDLLSRIPIARAARVVDLGCGPGNSTEILAARYGGAEIVGIDTSPAMIEAARKRLPQARFEVADARSFAPPAPPDVLYANAVFQWLPDHAGLLGRLAGLLAPGGALAFQVPDNLHEATHTSMREAAIAIGRADIVEAAESERTPIGSFEDYWNWLSPSCSRIDVWRTTYVHPVADHGAVVTFLESTGLRPYLNRLGADEGVGFKARYREAIEKAYPATNDGKVLLRFPRLFVIAVARS